VVKITFHTFGMGDVEDPELYASLPLGEFMDTDKGQWIRDNCQDPQYIIRPDPHTYGTRVIVYGEVEDKQAVEWILRWGRFDCHAND
jgi:hypothetical protein